MQDLARKVLEAVLVFVATAIAGKAAGLVLERVTMPSVLRALTVDIWFVWLGLVAGVAFYLIVTTRQQLKRRREELERWRRAVETNLERVRVGAQMAVNQMGNDQHWDRDTHDANRIKIEWPQE